MSLAPLHMPEIPVYYQLPFGLEHEVKVSFQLRATITEELAARRSADPSFAGFLAETGLEIALACAKMATSLAVCHVQDWLDEVDP